MESPNQHNRPPPRGRALQLRCPFPDCEGGVKDEMHRTWHCLSLTPLADRSIRLVQCLRILLIRKMLSTTSGSSLLSV